MNDIIKLKLKYIIGKIIKLIIGKYAIAILVKTKNGLFAVDPEDFGVGRCIIKKGNWENAPNDFIKNYLNSESSVLIIGAHIGALTIPVSKLCKTIIAIEPNPQSFFLLDINLKLNHITNCQAFCVAANDKNERLEFVQNISNSGGCKRKPKYKRYLYYYDSPNKIYVNGVMLDKYLEINEFDLIIMDIEGSEYFALKGMQKILCNSQSLQIEFLPHHLRNVSGINVDELLDLIEPHFSELIVPSLKLKV